MKKGNLMDFLTAQEARELRQLIINDNNESIFLETHQNFLNELAEKVRQAVSQGHNCCNMYASYKIVENEFYTLTKIIENLGYEIKIDNNRTGIRIYLYW